MKIIFAFLLLFQFNNFSFSQKITVYGTVSDRLSGEFLIGANLYFSENNLGIATNNYGFYSISLLPGFYSIICSHIGYQSDTIKLEIKNDLKLDIGIESVPITIDEIVIIGKTDLVDDPVMNKNSLSAKQIIQIPAVFGQADVLKSLIFLPGIQSVKPGSSSLSVRGGTHSQNLILLDEAVVYNPDHSLSFFSVFNPEVIKDITVYKGGFPAQYGGRLSSVIDIRMKEGNSQSIKGNANIGLLSSGITLEGPLFTKKGSFLVSSRYSYAGSIANGIKALTEIIPVYPLRNMPGHNKVQFYDLNFKFNYTFNPRNRIYISGYSGHDNFFFRILSNNSQMDWGNRTFTIRYNHIFNSKIFSNHSFILSNYGYAYHLTEDQRKYQWTSELKDYQVKSDYEWFVSPELKVSFGLNSSFHKIHPGSIKKTDSTSIIRSFSLENKSALESALYLSVKKKFSNRIVLDLGIRYNTFMNIGPGTVYRYDANFEETVDSTVYTKNEVIDFFHGLEPRVNFVLFLNTYNSLKMSWCVSKQYIHQLTNSSVGLPTDIWLPATKYMLPLNSNIFSIGYFRSNETKSYESSIELYYRDINRILDYKNNADLFLNSHVETQVLSGISKAYGIEFQLKKTSGKLNGWISYTLSKALLKVNRVNNDLWYHATYDRMNNLSLTGNYSISRTWSINSSFVFTSGGYCTVPKEAFFYNGVPFVQYTSRNGYKLPYYHHLDFSVDFSSSKNEFRKFKSEWTFGIYNVYNRKNVFSLFIDYDSDLNLVVKNLYLYGMVPFVNYSIRF